jgi:hypothetical protein
VRLLPAIAASGRLRLYNLAAGHNTSHGDIAACLSRALGWHTEFTLNAPTVQFPPIATTRLLAEFQAPSGDLSTDLPTLASRTSGYRRQLRDPCNGGELGRH